jgi:hypothetical protein
MSYSVTNAKNSQFLLDDRLDSSDVAAMRSSSDLAPQDGNSYGPGNLLDMDFTTAWCPGGPAGGVGSWVEFDMEPCLIGTILLGNGYTKSAEAYAANSRARSVRLILTGDPDNPHGYGCEGVISDEVITLEDRPWVELDRGNFARGLQSLFSTGDMGEAVGRIRLEILEVYPGDACDDLCISELVISGYDGDDFARWESD